MAFFKIFKIKYLSLALLCVALSACNFNSKETTKADIDDSIKVNDNDINKISNDDIIKVDDKDIVEFSNNKALECHNTIPDWQIKELAQVPCLTLPISNQNFLDIQKFDNGMFNVQGDSKYSKSQDYYKQLLLGLISYSANETFLISFSNDQAEDGYPNQSFHITSIKKDNEKDSLYTLGLYPLGLLNYAFQDSELIKLGIDPNEFADIDFNTLGEKSIRIDDTCMMNFSIDTDWRLTRSYYCQNSQAAQETIDSFKEQFGFNYKLVNIDGEVDYERLD